MRTILLLALFTACGGRDKSSPEERRDVAIDTMGALWPAAALSTEGERSDVLVVGAQRCNRTILDVLYRDGVKNYLERYSFRVFRCARGGAEMGAPWE